MIYLIGGAGNGNFGDELIVRCWLEFLRERRGRRAGGLRRELRQHLAALPRHAASRRSASSTTSTG